MRTMRGFNRRGFLAGSAGSAALLSTRARAQANPVKLGCIGPMSGPAQVVGAEIRLGAEVARAQVNRMGGINGRPLEFALYDDRTQPNLSVAGVRELATSGVNLMFGVPTAASAMAVIGVLPSLNVVMTCTGSAEERLTHELFNRNFFITSQNNYTRQRLLAREVAGKYPNVLSWTAILPDIAAGHDSWAVFSRAIVEYHAKAGRKAVLQTPIFSKFGNNDYKVQISALMSTEATGLYSLLFGNDGITFFQQARPFALEKKFQVIAEAGQEMDLPKALKRNVPEHVWAVSYYNFTAFKDNPDGQELQQAYQKEFGDPIPHGLAGVSHVGVRCYAEAIKAAGSTETDKVIAALETLKFNTIRGPAYYRREDHQMIAAQSVVNWGPAQTDAGFEVREVVTVKDEEMVNPPTPGVQLKM